MIGLRLAIAQVEHAQEVIEMIGLCVIGIAMRREVGHHYALPEFLR